MISFCSDVQWVSGVRCQGGDIRELNPDTSYETTPKWHGLLMIRPAAFQASGGAYMKLHEIQSHFYEVSGLIKLAASAAGLTPDT